MSGLVHAREDPQQRRLPGAVETQHDDPRAPVDREVDVGEHLQRPVGPRQPGRPQRRPARGSRVGEPDLRHLVGHPLALEAGQQPLGPAGHVLGGDRLGGLGPHLVGLGHQGAGLLLGVLPLALPAPLVGLTLREVGLPADVVEVQLGPVRVQVEHPVDHGVEHLHVVADDHEAALVPAQEVAQPPDRVGVEVVRGLVEEQRRRAGEEDPGQLDPAPLASGQGRQRLVEDPVLEPERRGDPRGLGLRRIPALGVERRVEPRVPRHRLLAHPVVLRGHQLLGGPQVVDDRVEPARGEDAVAGQHGEVAGARVLREVPHVARPRHGAGRRLALAGEHLGERRLARAVAPDQPDAVARGDAERRAVEEEPRTGAQLDPRGHDHNRRFCQCRLRGPNRFPQSPVLSPTVTRAIEVRTVDAAQHLAFVEARSGSFLQTPAWGRLKTDWRAESLGWFRPSTVRDGRRRPRPLPEPPPHRPLPRLPARGPGHRLGRSRGAGRAADPARPRQGQGAFALRIGPRGPGRAAGTPTRSRRRSPTTPSAPCAT